MPIQTWDDVAYRRIALEEHSKISTQEAFKGVLLPNPKTAGQGDSIGVRSVGYHTWLVLGLKLFGSSNSELIFQLVNLTLFLIQAIVVFLFGWWSTGSCLISLSVTFLYLSAPIVFGLNRWIMTENHVFSGLLIFSCLSFWLLATLSKDSLTSSSLNSNRLSWKQIAYPALVAYTIGIFTTIREYAVPSTIILTVCVPLALLLEKRWLSATTFLVVIYPFAQALTVSAPPALKKLISESGKSIYFNTLPMWFIHGFQFAVGPALSILLFVLVLLIIFYLATGGIKFITRKYNNVSRSQKPVGIGLCILFIAHIILIMIYAAGVIHTQNRVIRPIILPMITTIGLVFIGAYIIQSIKNFLLTLPAKLFLLTLILTSWVTLTYQLFFAFEGGKTYRHHAWNMEIYNHPIHLCSLKEPGCSHITY